MHLGRAVLFLFCAASSSAADLSLSVKETAGVARVGEIVRSGVPLPRALSIATTDRLAVLDPDGHAVPAEFRILGRWNAGLATNAPIQWLLVSFPATVGANATARYRLVTEGINPAPATPLRLTREGDRVTVDTGAATFVVGGKALFDEVRVAGALRISGGALTAQIDGHDTALSTIRRVAIEQSGPLVATVIVDGAYDLAPIGGGGIGSHRRYRFAAGSPTAIVERSVTWEGDRCGVRGDIECNGMRNAVLVTGVRDTLISAGGVITALDHTQRYQPQAAAGDVIDLASDKVWLGTRQGLFATFAVSVVPGTEVAAPLNHPLRAWPTAEAFAAVEDFPAGALPPAFADYDRAVRGVLTRTQQKIDEVGLNGLMTFGLYPRIWGNPIYSDEVSCGGSPSWDETYWCSTWTDYHNTAATAAIWAMRSGEVEWLDELARPAALRMLYTQIYQCSPSDDFFYCGQAPAGYGGYRADFNSSHAYFDNLQLYYWLSGDSTVVDTLARGATSMRGYLCSRRPAAPCNAGDPPTDEYANLTGRVASQWFSVFRFVGLAGADASFLDDWRANLGRAVTQQFLLLGQYGFMLGDWRPVTTAGTNTTDQLWMTALYDMKNLERLRRDTNDAPIGSPPLRPSEIITAYARTLERFARGAWPNQLDVTWSGARVGGAIVSVRANGGGGDPFLYDTGRASLSGPVAEAAAFTGDAALRALAIALTTDAIAASIADGGPLGKLQGEYLARLHGAVAALAAPPPRRRAAKP